MWSRLDQQFTSEQWNAFIAKYGPASGRFLQSWEWGEFAGGERWVLGGEGEKGQRGVATVVYKRISGLGRYTYCPRGPVVEGGVLVDMTDLAECLGNIAFLRFDPPSRLIDAGSGNPAYVKRTLPIQPPMTRLTDLSPTEGELMAAMHHKLRYNIRVAERNDVSIRFDMNDLERVWHLFEATSGRGEFRLHDKSYYARMLATVRGECRAFLATAWFEDQPVAANIMVDFAGVRTYLHGASSYEHRFFMAPHLLHWELLRDAKWNGLTTYDWWGISPEDDHTHSWAGVSRFKRQFPGQDISYPGTYDLVKRPVWYRVYSLARALRRLL